jgi:hypothetical protein
MTMIRKLRPRSRHSIPCGHLFGIISRGAGIALGGVIALR